MKTILTFIAFLIIAVSGSAQINKADLITRLGRIMEQNYVFPEKGKAMQSLLRAKLEAGAYDTLLDRSDLAAQLQADLRSVIFDKHIRVYDQPSGRSSTSRRRSGRSMNYGFVRTEHLENGIGYLDLRGFASSDRAQRAGHEAMKKLMANDAIIFDLRQNGGGSPVMIRLISSYLFGDESVHLNTFYWRPDDLYEESWTTPSDAPIKKPDIPIFILTSERTFSAAEEFTYNLKHLKRATIVGDTTGGGAHPGGTMPLNQGFSVWVPQGRAINPITKTNWEGIGVIPHVTADTSQALDIALRLAREALLEQ